MNQQFRSFSVLEEEKKDSIQKPDKNTKLTKTHSEGNLSSTEEKVRIQTLCLFLFSYKPIFFQIESPPIVDTTNLCRYCHKDIPPSNLQLHEIYCQRVNPLPSVSTITNGTSVR